MEQQSAIGRTSYGFAFVGLLVATNTWAAELVYVQSKQAELLAEPRIGAPVVASLQRGTEVKLLDRQNNWYRVERDEAQGWVFRFMLAEHPPPEKSGPALRDDIDHEHVRRRASAVVTAGATRGLTPEERSRAHEEGLADYSALTHLDDMVVSEKEVEAFIAEGIPQ